MLEDGGFVTSAESDGKRVYTITDAGRELLAANGAGIDDADESEDARQRARQSMMKLMAAIFSARSSDDATLDKIREIVDRARRDVYAVLAADES
jgi:DNA-binding PadR family transcriptional regulator